MLVDNFHLVASAAFPSSTNCHSTPFLTLVVSLVTSTFAAGALPCVATFNLDSLLAQAVSVPLILKEREEPLCPRALSFVFTKSLVGVVPPRKALNVCQLPSFNLTSTFSELTGLDVTKNQDLLVRTGANAKKIASKVGRVTLKKPEGALTVGAGGKITGTGAAINVGSKVGVIVSATLAYDITKGALIQNVSDKDIEYALVPSTGDTSKFKWSVLKASKDPVKKPTKANLKHSTDEKANTWTEGKTKLFLRLSGTKQDKNGVATRSGVSAGAILAIEKIAQAFTFESGTVAGDATKAEIAASATTAAIKVATGTAATFTINAKIDKVVNPKGGSPKVKVVKALPKGVTYKVGKVDGATGKFTITVNVSNKAFVTADPSGEAEFGLTYEGVNSGFKVTFAKKN